MHMKTLSQEQVWHASLCLHACMCDAGLNLLLPTLLHWLARGGNQGPIDPAGLPTGPASNSCIPGALLVLLM